VSRTNNPCGRSGRMSPPGSLMQNVDPSISVTGLQDSPWGGGDSPDDHAVIRRPTRTCGGRPLG
jgi:hypothetical protein